MVNNGVIPLILEVVKRNLQNEMVLESAVGLISHLAPESDCADELRMHSGIELLFLVLQEHEDVIVVKKCLLALKRMAQSDTNARTLDTIASGGEKGSYNGVSHVVSAFRKCQYEDAVVKETCNLLLALKLPEDVLMELAAAPMMEVLPLHEHDPEVTKVIADLLSTLPIEDDNMLLRGC